MTNSESNYVAIIREICTEEDIALQSFSFDWIFRLTKNGKTGFILGYQFGLNSASVNSICCDKSAASELMTALGIPNISHILFASPPEQKFVGNCGFMEELLALLKKHGCLVVKPNDGTGGDRVYKVTTPCGLETAVFEIFQKSAYLRPDAAGGVSSCKALEQYPRSRRADPSELETQSRTGRQSASGQR